MLVAPLAAALCLLIAAAPLSAATLHHGARSDKVVALTFDDGYSPLRVRQILDVLVSNGVPATFFPYANAVVRSPSTWRAVVAAGYPVGNHTVAHRKLTALSPAAIRREICGFRALVDPVLGERSIDWFRPPYGRWSPLVASIAASCGYQHILLWDVDSRDWTGESPAAISRLARTGRSGSIVLMHAGPANTPFALQQIIDAYRARGYEFVTVQELLAGAVPAETSSEPLAVTTSGGSGVGQETDWSAPRRRVPMVD
jgi:peptidoglycan/xylan/chitin deacetylase (PgdA/CDA1 family)